MIREIEEKDNAEIEKIIRTCLKEFGGDREGLAWSDPDLGRFSEVYAKPNRKYWVIEEDGILYGGCGIGELEGTTDVCELQKMYLLKEKRGTGIAKKLMEKALDFAREHYKRCYIETLSNMVAANRFYQKYGFIKLEKPYLITQHYSCDVWYLKDLKDK